MKTNLKESFFKTFTIAILWLTFLVTALGIEITVSINYFWIIILSSLIIAGVFGVLYNALWYHLTLKSSWNILISSIANIIAGFSMLFLLSKPLFIKTLNWIIPISALTIIIHVIIFHFYAKYKTKQESDILNNKIAKMNIAK